MQIEFELGLFMLRCNAQRTKTNFKRRYSLLLPPKFQNRSVDEIQSCGNQSLLILALTFNFLCHSLFISLSFVLLLLHLLHTTAEYNNSFLLHLLHITEDSLNIIFFDTKLFVLTGIVVALNYSGSPGSELRVVNNGKNKN